MYVSQVPSFSSVRLLAQSAFAAQCLLFVVLVGAHLLQ